MCEKAVGFIKGTFSFRYSALKSSFNQQEVFHYINWAEDLKKVPTRCFSSFTIFLLEESMSITLVTFGLFLIMSPLCKKCMAAFWAIFGKLGNFLFYHLVTLDPR